MGRSHARLAIFLSGRGSGFQAIYRATQDGSLDAQIVYVISSNDKAGGMQLSISYGFETSVFSTREIDARSNDAIALLARLRKRNVDYIVLAGYMNLLPHEIVAAYQGRIVNIHPALLPKYGGKGMYGMRVHRAVIQNGDAESGATVHLVDERYDNGRILEQVRVPVHPDDSPETLAARVLIEEHRLYPRVLQKLITGQYEVTND